MIPSSSTVESSSPVARLPRPRFNYIEIPAADVQQSAAFYGKVFGWKIHDAKAHRPGFSDATGNIGGAFVSGRPAAREAGFLLYIWVDSIETTLALVKSQLGEVVEPAHLGHPGAKFHIATFRDPAGNLIGLYQEM